MSRRTFLQGALAAALAGGSARLWAGEGKAIPQRPSARIIVDNDFAGDPDGLAAFAHHLLSPKARVVLATVSALDPKLTDKAIAGRTAAAGAELARELARLVGKAVPVAAGPEDFDPGASPAARAIVDEAMRDDRMPLFLTCGGPLTNVAAALRLEPRIAERMTLVWIGGGGYPAGGWEYNLATDGAAARFVIAKSRVPLWQVPQPAYRQMQISIAELAADLRSISPLSQWLYDRFTSPPEWADIGGSWPLGDTPMVLLTSVSAESSVYRDLNARRIMPDFRYGSEIPGRKVRVYEQLDARLAFADFLALLRLNAR